MHGAADNVTCPKCLKNFWQHVYMDGSYVCPDCRKPFKTKRSDDLSILTNN